MSYLVQSICLSQRLAGKRLQLCLWQLSRPIGALRFVTHLRTLAHSPPFLPLGQLSSKLKSKGDTTFSSRVLAEASLSKPCNLQSPKEQMFT